MWIGLHHYDYFHNNAEPCRCRNYETRREDCLECRRQFTWLDGTPVDNMIDNWTGNKEPSLIEQCARLRNDGKFIGNTCNSTLGYVCSRGMHIFSFNHVLVPFSMKLYNNA